MGQEAEKGPARHKSKHLRHPPRSGYAAVNSHVLHSRGNRSWVLGCIWQRRRLAMRTVRYRVVAAGMKRMATGYSSHSEYAATRKAVKLQRLSGIFRAGWRKSARGGEHRRNCSLIQCDESNRKALHRRLLWRFIQLSHSCSNSAQGASAAPGFATTTTSRPVGQRWRCNRYNSRSRRRVNERAGECPTFLDTVIPIRPSASAAGACRNVRNRPRWRRPACCTRRKSYRFRSRNRRRKRYLLGSVEPEGARLSTVNPG